MNILHKHFEALRTSLWFVPTLIVVGSIALAMALIEVDSSDSSGQLAERWPRLFGAGAEGSRGLLSAIADSMITVAVLTRPHQVLVIVAGRTSDEQRQNVIRQHSALVTETAERSIPSVYDRATIQAAQVGHPGVVTPAKI